MITTDSTVVSPVPASTSISRRSILDAANQAVKDNYLWSFELHGKFSGPNCDKTWAAIPGRIMTTCSAYRYYFSRNEGNDKSSIHDMA